MSRKKSLASAPVALGILRSLDPPRTDISPHPQKVPSEERFTIHSDTGHRDRDRDRERDLGDKKERWAFWNRDKDREKDKDKEKDKERLFERGREGLRGKERKEDESQAELTRMIGYLTATASEDWALVLEVCERASANENNAKEAVRALRREFKYGEPPAQLSAARLWAIMLRNSSDLFISQSTARKFFDTLEDLINSPRTSPVVRERVLHVIAAAAYASGSKKDSGFRGLWKRVKPADKPDEGIPLDNDEAMFHPPVSSRGSHFEIPLVSYHEASPLPLDSTPLTPLHNPQRKRKSPTRNRIIPPEEDIRRLFQECQIGQWNASLLSQALALATPEDLKRKDVIKEFYFKSRASQELIFAQIPWASAGAEKSRVLKDEDSLTKGGFPNETDRLAADDSPVELTTEENLLDALLAANAELIEALQQYDDLERVGMERKAEDQSRKENRIDRSFEQDVGLLTDPSLNGESASSSPSPSHSPLLSALAHPFPHHLQPHSITDTSALAPPPAAPHGPRSLTQGSIHSRTPSPGTPDVNAIEPSGVIGFDLQGGMNALSIRQETSSSVSFDEDDTRTTVKPSAKALGKRKVVDAGSPEPTFDDDIYFDEREDNLFLPEDRSDSDSEEDMDGWQRRPVRYVYDAAAERTQQRIREGHYVVMDEVQ